MSSVLVDQNYCSAKREEKGHLIASQAYVCMFHWKNENPKGKVVDKLYKRILIIEAKFEEVHFAENVFFFFLISSLIEN